MGTMKEFSVIDKYFRPLAKEFAGALDLCDDAALLAVPPGQELVVTKDLIVSGIHFIGDEPPAQISQKSLRVKLSDFAAKGATPLAYSMGLAWLDKNFTESWIADFTQGLGADQKQFQIHLLGGDTTRSQNDLVISITAYGLVPQGQMVRRNGARAGDHIFVTGTIGDAGLGLRILKSNGQGDAYLMDRYRLPQPRLHLIRELKKNNLPHVAIDISDGLLADLRHILDTSGVGATINLDKMPLSAPAKGFINQNQLRLQDIASMGDDYEILFTAPQTAEFEIQKIAKSMNITVSMIGQISDTKELKVLDAGQPITINKLGYEH